MHVINYEDGHLTRKKEYVNMVYEEIHIALDKPANTCRDKPVETNLHRVTEFLMKFFLLLYRLKAT